MNALSLLPTSSLSLKPSIALCLALTHSPGKPRSLLTSSCEFLAESKRKLGSAEARWTERVRASERALSEGVAGVRVGARVVVGEEEAEGEEGEGGTAGREE